MKPSGTVLILSHTPADWAEVRGLLSDRGGYRVLVAADAAGAAVSLADAHVDLVIAENGIENGEAVAFLARLRKSHPDVVRLLVVAGDCYVPQRAARDAAIYQFLHKPVDPEQLALVVQRGLEARDMTRRNWALARDLHPSKSGSDRAPWLASLLHGEPRYFESLVYVSEAMQDLCSRAAEAAGTDFPILIQGETGAGKEWLARAIHAHSPRQGGPFRVVRCAGLTDAQWQAELFPATDEAAISRDRRRGLFGAGGTVFLHEVGETSRASQAQLLRFLDRSGKTPCGVDESGGDFARIIAGATRPLRDLVASGDFRQDLCIRLRGFELDIPPLRERLDDLPVLAELFTAKYSAAAARRILGISASALEKLAAYDFPGNVGELESEIRRMVAVAKDGEYLTTRLLSPAILTSTRSAPPPETTFSPAGATLKDKVESLERHILREALLRHKWNRSRVAEALGLSRVGLANKIRRYGLNEHR